MDCREFERNLDASLAEHAPASLREGARAHMARCASCRELAELARASLGAGAPGGGLVEAVLERTTGSPCLPARELLAAGEAGLEATDRRLLDLHRDRCPGCRELGETLAWLDRLLPGMAEVRPDPGFLRDVLLATSERRRASSPIDEWLRAWLGITIRRPRFALEAAYVGAMVLWLVFGTAVSPLKGVPRQTLEIVQSGSAGILDASMGPMADALTMPASASRWAWEMTAGRLSHRGTADQGRWTRIGGHARSFTMHALKAMGGASAGRFDESREQLRLMTIDLESIWNEITGRGSHRDLQTLMKSQPQEA